MESLQKSENRIKYLQELVKRAPIEDKAKLRENLKLERARHKKLEMRLKNYRG